MASDPAIHEQISALVAEEHELRRRLGNGTITPDEERVRLSELETRLDQCWDLLRQRDARREFGQNPDEAAIRPELVVENYES